MSNKLRNSDIVFSVNNKRIPINTKIVCSMLITFYLAVILFFALFIQALIHKTITHLMFIELVILAICIFYGMIADFIFEWQLNKKYIFYSENNKKHLKCEYHSLPVFTNKTLTNIEFKEITSVTKKKNKYVLYGDFNIKKPMKAPQNIKKYTVSEIDLENFELELKSLIG